MSEGATMSAPARACESAASARIIKLGSFSTSLIFDHAAVPVAGVFAEADIGNHQQIQFRLANRLHRTLHRDHARSAASLASASLFSGRPKRNHAGIPRSGDFAAFLHNLIDRLLKNSRHRTHFVAHFGARAGKHRVDHAAHRKFAFRAPARAALRCAAIAAADEWEKS